MSKSYFLAKCYSTQLKLNKTDMPKILAQASKTKTLSSETLFLHNSKTRQLHANVGKKREKKTLSIKV
jgi:hypothetical protein